MFINLNRCFIDTSLEKVLAVPFWVLQNNQFEPISAIKYSHRFLRKVINFFYNCVLKQPLVDTKNNQFNDILFIRAYSRDDLDDHSKKYEDAIDNISVCVLTRKIIKIDFLTLPKVLIVLFTIRKQVTCAYKSNNVKILSQEGIDIFFDLLFALSDSIKLLPHIIAGKKVISFQEMVPVENLICQIANSLGKTTFALQHALGAYSEEGSYEARYSRIHYEPSVCSYVLVWGEYTKHYFEKFTQNNVTLIGKPTLPKIDNFIDGATFVFEADDDINRKLLEFSYQIEACGYSVSRWFRPGHKLAIEAGADRVGPLRKIIIGWRSSLLVELGFLGGNVFLIPESVFATCLPEELVVNNAKEIIEKFDSPLEYPHEVWMRFICCTGNDSVNRFKSLMMLK